MCRVSSASMEETNSVIDVSSVRTAADRGPCLPAINCSTLARSACNGVSTWWLSNLSRPLALIESLAVSGSTSLTFSIVDFLAEGKRLRSPMTCRTDQFSLKIKCQYPRKFFVFPLRSSNCVGEICSSLKNYNFLFPTPPRLLAPMAARP